MNSNPPNSELPIGTVTFLFTDIQGSTQLLHELREDYPELLAQHHALLRAAIANWQGQEVDTQGDAFFVSFGRASQAVRCVVEIQRLLAEQSWPGGVEVRVRMGLHTGEPLVAVEGYVGMDVHRAARIAHVGHGGQVLLSETTAALVKSELPQGVGLLDLGRHRLKDIHQPEHIQELVIQGLPSEFPPLTSLEALPPESYLQPGVVKLPAFLEDSEEDRRAPVFVGRQRELGRLDEALERALAGQGNVVFVTGGPGRGKTATLREFSRSAMGTNPELLALRGSCSAFSGVGDPYLPFREILAMLVGELESRWAAGEITNWQATRIWEALPVAMHALLEDGPNLVNLFVSGRRALEHARMALGAGSGWLERLGHLAEADPAAASDLQQVNLFEQYRQVLSAIAQRHPLVLALDDLQWADGASLNLLFHLGRRLEGQRILIVAAYRPEEVAIGRGAEEQSLKPILSEFKRQYGEAWIDLSRIPQAESDQFIAAYLEVEPNRLSAAFRQQLGAHTAGHPLFTVELLRDLQERGDLLKDEAGYWVEGPDLDWGVLPARVEGVIEERIGRLQAELRDILTVASVEGEDFTTQVVARLRALDERGLARQISRELEVRHRLVGERGVRQVGQRRLYLFHFNHRLFQQHFYNSLGRIEREILHAEVGSALEDLYAGQVIEIAPQLALHFEQAVNPQKAVQYLLLAGDKARDLYAYQEAIDYYQRAQAIQRQSGDYQQAARTLMKLGLVYHTALDFTNARLAYQQGFDLWQLDSQAAENIPQNPAPHPLRVSGHSPTNLDPSLAGDNYSAAVIDQLFSGLVELTPSMEVVPDVARSWEVLEGGLKYRFYLRDDVFWSDGQPLTARDFEYAWKRILDPAIHSENAQLLFDIKGAYDYYQGLLTDPNEIGVCALDDTTLQVELEGQTGYFLYLLSHSTLSPVPQHVVATHGAAWTQLRYIVTNGPFLLDEWRPGEFIRLLRNPGYHGSFRGNLQRVELHFAEYGQVHLEKYAQHDFDILDLWGFQPQEMVQAQGRFTGEYISAPRLATGYVGFNVRQAPLDDWRVRQALALSLDKEHLAHVVLRGYYFPATGGFVPPGIPGYSEDISLPYDPQRARALLAKAGYPRGNDFPVIHGLSFAGAEAWTEYTQSQWREQLGIQVSWQIGEWGKFLNDLTGGNYQVYAITWQSDYPDPDSFLRASNTRSLSNWQDEAYDQLVEQAWRMADQGQRLELYRQADRMLIEKASIIPLSYGRHHLLVKPWVKNLSMFLGKFWPWKNVILEPH